MDENPSISPETDKPHDSPTQSVANGEWPRSRFWSPWKTLCAVGLVGVVVSAFFFAFRPFSASPLAGLFLTGDACAIMLLHMILATFFLSIVLLNPFGPNTIANHGGVGLLIGLSLGFIFMSPLKGGPVLVLFAAFPGALIGLVIGWMRSEHAEPSVVDSDTSEGEDRGP